MIGTVSWLSLSPSISTSIPLEAGPCGFKILVKVHLLTISALNSDSYPLGFDCANPSTWPSGSIPTYFRADHLKQSPTTPYTLNEFQVNLFFRVDMSMCPQKTNAAAM